MLSRWNLTMFAFSFLRALICINNNQGTTYCINNYQGTRYWGALMFIWHWSLGCFIHIIWIYKELLTNTLYFTSRNQMSAGLRFRSSIQNTYSYHRFRASDKHILQKSFLVFLWFSLSLEHIFVIIFYEVHLNSKLISWSFWKLVRTILITITSSHWRQWTQGIYQWREMPLIFGQCNP